MNVGQMLGLGVSGRMGYKGQK